MTTHMTKPRPWPNNALEARDASVEEAFAAITALQPIAAGKPMTQDQLRVAAMNTITHLQEIRVQLASVGAKVRP